MTLIRFVLTLVVAASGWAAPSSAASALPDPSPAALHARYDQHHAESLKRIAPERGTPSTYRHSNADAAAGLGGLAYWWSQ